MLLTRFLFIRRLPCSNRIWRRNQTNSLVQISTSHSQKLYQWNKAMTESNKNQTPTNTLVLFDQLINQHSELTPDFITYLLALTACIHLRNLYEGKRIHEYIQQHWSILTEKNQIIKVQTCLIQLYATCDDLKTAEEILYKENLSQQAISVHTLMKGYIIHNRAKLAIELAKNLNKTERNIVTYILWANAIAKIGDTNLAEQFHNEFDSLSPIIRTYFSQDQRLLNALIDMNGKCGNILRMEEIFQSMTQPDIITFTTMAKAYIINNLSLKALEVYDHLKQIKQITRDEIMYLVAANAAGKLGLLSRARSIHEDIISSGISYETNIKIVNTL